MIKKTLLSICSLGLTLGLFAQAQEDYLQNFCGTYSAQAAISRIIAENPLLAEEEDVYVKDGEDGDVVADSTTVYIIPIVFHVLHEYGSENISDEQIYRQVELLNLHFRKLNPDTIEIIPEFRNIAGDSKIEFRLAKIDPFGNPTNGIVRHFTHETNWGDAYSKIDQWPRSRYVNVWVNRTMGSSPSAAGYAIQPINLDGTSRFMDGIMIKHDYIGDIGTGTTLRSTALTHELGHWLGLDHVWGGTNQPGVACGDDGIEDTPITRGFTICPSPANAMICNDTIVENFQNFMDYSYCSHMYTKGQVQFMRNTLVNQTAQRDELWTETNLQNTIPDDAPSADPVADFWVTNNQLTVSVGQSIQFKNFSWRLYDGVPSYTWEFEDGVADNANAENPTVIFSDWGWKDVSLTVEVDGKVNTVTKNKFLYVFPDWPVFSKNVSLTFEENEGWISLNPYNYEYQWKVRSDAGKDNSGGIFLDMTNPYGDNYVLYSDGFFFNNRRGLSKNVFVSQPIDIKNMSDVTISFEWACASDGKVTYETNNGVAEKFFEELRVYTSIDYGKTWSPRKAIVGQDLINNGSGWDSFYPNPNTVWSTSSFPVSSSNNNVLIKFEYLGSDKSNNIAIDNVTVNGTLNTESEVELSNIDVFPNPSNNVTGWNISYDANLWGGADVQLTDMAGRIVTTSKLPMNESVFNIKDFNATQGVYVLRITNHEKSVQKKLILK